MVNLKAILFLGTALTICGCSSRPSKPVTAKDLVGTWVASTKPESRITVNSNGTITFTHISGEFIGGGETDTKFYTRTVPFTLETTPDSDEYAAELHATVGDVFYDKEAPEHLFFYIGDPDSGNIFEFDRPDPNAPKSTPSTPASPPSPAKKAKAVR